MFVGTLQKETPFVGTLQEEIPLLGGDVTEGVVRVGDTVRRPVRASSRSVHALLRHLERAGFDGAPRVLGVDEQGREILSYVEGGSAARPLPAYALADESLAALARLLRGFHDAAEGFTPPTGAVWEAGSNDDAAPQLVGHCDVNLDNVIFRDGLPAALIDFDMARPTTRLFDVVTTLRHWAPIADPVDLEPLQRRLEVGPRLRSFCDAYGLAPRDRRRLLDLARLRFDRSYHAMRAKAAAEGGGWARMWAGGAGMRIRRACAWLEIHQDELHEYLV
ncbi:Ser/Thr protein kinase RdoA (MazF antagonist) [Streptosporangium becharense]|uniref:Ser/Thr protein kinase RdoA (MazF antagonist) n=1 Tax=Streptosporangium becharense TaxID=1816182 RepID=A0A7W9IJN5_9ACTN|nr:aminoglycoside phosphotransferase family protein [Streptosporangium becharense]MBB2911002.1 Ser/Thr protein kinase RdoA (MazF antagonist) [Streptosporangium becharense]MBB5821940.1 Ser/Thr protein kinase RdoA (MazF antagonist) [Streptosporangium becharense]